MSELSIHIVICVVGDLTLVSGDGRPCQLFNLVFRALAYGKVICAVMKYYVSSFA